MRRDFLDSLHCPYSGLPISVSMELEGGEEINYGIASTETTDFPIVEGILRLHFDEYREPIIRHLRAGRQSQALAVALDVGPFGDRTSKALSFASSLAFRTGFNSVGERLIRLTRKRVRSLTDTDATFATVAAKLSSRSSYAHQMCRFTMPGFLSTFALAHLVWPNGRVLCFACGTGHEAFLISRLWPSAEIVCADYSFCALYMAKKYFAPRADYVCLDGDYLLPFDSGQFSTIFSSDTLPVLTSKLNLAQEFTRVSNDQAVTLLPHMHNRLVSPFAQSLTPAGYRQLFREGELRILPDNQVVQDYFFNDILDLSRNRSNEELAASGQHLCIVACRDSSIFRRRENLWEHRLRSIRHSAINPVYVISGHAGNWQLRRCVDVKYAKSVTQLGQACIPDVCEVSAPFLDRAGLLEMQRTDASQFARLARALVILDLPEKFTEYSRTLDRSIGLLFPRQAV
jgi:ubiquinone/menaquinone biosynthesis C-methylase UbiE